MEKLELMGVQELDTKEAKSIDGGVGPLFWIGVGIALYAVYDHVFGDD